MRPFLKVILVIVLCAGIIGGIFYFFPKEITVEKEKTSSLISGSDILNKAVDSDSDGLKDWEESLWKTDPKNPDSDGDGTNDGEETKSGRDPLRAGPNDKFEENAPQNPKEAEIKEITETDKFAAQFFQKYMEMGGGQTLNDAQKQAIVQSILEERPIPKPPIKYGFSDIKVIDDESVGALRAYANATGDVFIKNALPKGTEHELVILQNAYNNDSESELSKLDPIIKSYEGIIADLLKIPAPKSLSDLHLQLIIASNAVKSSIEGMKLTFKDTLKAVESVQYYPQGVNTLTDAFLRFKKFYADRGISFEQGTGGYELLNTI